MKVTLSIIALLTSLTAWPVAGATRLHIIGVSDTDLDFMYRLRFAESSWSGLLDCQSFLNHMRVSTKDRDVNLYLNGGDCEAWYDRIKHAGPGRPQCLDVDVNIKPVPCS